MRGCAEMGRNVLVVSTLEHEEPILRTAVGNADRIKVVVPVVKQGLLDWLANDERAFAHAAEVAEETADELPADDVEAAADEVVVAIRPGDRDALAERLDPGNGTARSIDGVPLRFVVIPDPVD